MKCDKSVAMLILFPSNIFLKILAPNIGKHWKFLEIFHFEEGFFLLSMWAEYRYWKVPKGGAVLPTKACRPRSPNRPKNEPARRPWLQQQTTKFQCSAELHTDNLFINQKKWFSNPKWLEAVLKPNILEVRDISFFDWPDNFKLCFDVVVQRRVAWGFVYILIFFINSIIRIFFVSFLVLLSRVQVSVFCSRSILLFSDHFNDYLTKSHFGRFFNWQVN